MAESGRTSARPRMERNVAHVMNSAELREGARELTAQAVDLSRILLAHTKPIEHAARWAQSVQTGNRARLHARLE